MNETNQPWYWRLHWQILIAMAAGIVAGLIGGPELVPKVGWLGTLFIKLLRMIIVPLVVFSIVSGVASVGGGRDLGRLFGKTLGYYVLSSALAVLVGLVAVNLVKPGVGANITGAATRGGARARRPPARRSSCCWTSCPPTSSTAAAEADMLAVIFFSILFGISITAHRARSHRNRLLGFFDAGFQVMMKLTGGVIRFAPIGVFGLITRLVGTSGFESFRGLGLVRPDRSLEPEPPPVRDPAAAAHRARPDPARASTSAT